MNNEWVNTGSSGNFLLHARCMLYQWRHCQPWLSVESCVWYLVEWDSDSQWSPLSSQTPLLTLLIIIVIWIFMTSFSFFPTASYATEISQSLCGGWPLEARDFPPFPASSIIFVFLQFSWSWNRGQDNSSWTILLSRSPIITLKVKGWKC